MHRLASLVLAFTLTASPALLAQNSSTPPKPQPPKPRSTAAPGAAPNKVWVNTTTGIYHCPGDRYYGKTKDGQYMTEKDARASGAHGSHNETCFK
jgi:hypothetical protein